MNKPAIVFAERPVDDREVKHLWVASARHLPEGTRLVQALRRPFMNYKEAREQYEALLGEKPASSPEARPKVRTFYPNARELACVTEPGEAPKPKPKPRDLFDQDASAHFGSAYDELEARELERREEARRGALAAERQLQRSALQAKYRNRKQKGRR